MSRTFHILKLRINPLTCCGCRSYFRSHSDQRNIIKNMNKLISIIILSFILSCGPAKTTSASDSIEQQPYFTKVGFPKDEPDKIYLNGIHAFYYELDKNKFTISDLNRKEIIKGLITGESGVWKSTIHFVELDKNFSNSKIIGRNDIIFKLNENNIINKDFKINKKLLLEFIEKYNEL